MLKAFTNLKNSKEIESNGSLNNNIGVSSKGKVMKYEVIEVVKCSTLTWFGHLERMARGQT